MNIRDKTKLATLAKARKDRLFAIM